MGGRQALTDSDENDWLETLLTSELFHRIPPANIQKLLTSFSERPVTIGERIVTQDEVGEECYVIKSGGAIVSRQDGKSEETLAALGVGDLFGEDALSSDLPRNASVTISSSGVLMVLKKEDFLTLLQQPVIDFIQEKDIPALAEERDTGVVLLDIRQPREVNIDPIHRAQNIPLAQLRTQLDGLSKSFIYLVYGDARAEAACYILSEFGFEAKVLKREPKPH